MCDKRRRRVGKQGESVRKSGITVCKEWEKSRQTEGKSGTSVPEEWKKNGKKTVGKE